MARNEETAMTAILTCTQRDLLILGDNTAIQLRQDRFRHQNVAAFGTAEPLLADRCLVVDAVAMCVRDALNRSQLKGIAPMGRRAAAMITLNFWPEWMEAFAEVEHAHQPIVFVVAAREDGVWWCGKGRADKLAPFVAEQSEQSPVQQLFAVNLERIRENIFKRATKAGIDLSAGRITLPPNDPMFVEWANEFKDERKPKFDPYRAKEPRRVSAKRRAAIEATAR
jgi:hypothetical protein